MIIDQVAVEGPRVLIAKGRVWIADHEAKWQVRTEVLCRFVDGPTAILSSMRVRIGDAAFASLEGHRDRNITRREPEAWLLEFEVDERGRTVALKP